MVTPSGIHGQRPSERRPPRAERYGAGASQGDSDSFAHRSGSRSVRSAVEVTRSGRASGRPRVEPVPPGGQRGQLKDRRRGQAASPPICSQLARRRQSGESPARPPRCRWRTLASSIYRTRDRDSGCTRLHPNRPSASRTGPEVRASPRTSSRSARPAFVATHRVVIRDPVAEPRAFVLQLLLDGVQGADEGQSLNRPRSVDSATTK